MRCPEAFEALSARFDGELRATEIPLLQAHLATCPDCRAQDQQLSLMARRLRGAAVEQPPVPAALRARITRSITPARPRRMPFVFGLALAGAGFGLGALAMVARARPAAVSPAELADAIRIEGEGDGDVQQAGAMLDGADQEWARVSQQLAREIGQKLDDDQTALQGHARGFDDRADDVNSGSGHIAPGTMLAPGNRIEAHGRSIEVALGSWGHLSLAPGGRLQIGQGTADLILLSGRATVDVNPAAPPLRLHAAGGEVVMPPGRFEIRAAHPRTRQDEGDRDREIDEATTTVAQVLTLTGNARISSGGQQLWLAAGTRGWLRPDRPPLFQDHLGGVPSPAFANAPSAPTPPAGTVGAGAAAPSAPIAAAAGTTTGASTPGSPTTPGPTTTNGSGMTVADRDPPSLGHGRLHGLIAFSAGEGSRRTASGDRNCPAQAAFAYVRLAPATSTVNDRRSADPDRPGASTTGVPASVPAVLDACGLNPPAVAVGLGQSIELHNQSDVARRISFGGSEITVAAGAVEQVHVGRSGRFDVVCDGASTPCGQIAVAAAPVIAITDAQGTFTVDKIPAGAHSVIAWRSDRATAFAQVDVQPNTTTEVRLTLPDDLPAAVAATLPANNGNRIAAPASSNTSADFDPPNVLAYGNGPNSCHFAHVDSPVGKACLQGGLRLAKREMKAMIKIAKDRGMKFDCDSCHKNEEDWKLNGEARTLFARVLETIKT
jgi:hypothetical protein